MGIKMAENYEYDEAKWLENSLQEIHAAWEFLRKKATPGEKRWLSQLKNHYLEIAKKDPEAAAEKLAIHERCEQLIEKAERTKKKKSA